MSVYGRCLHKTITFPFVITAGAARHASLETDFACIEKPQGKNMEKPPAARHPLISRTGTSNEKSWIVTAF